MPKEGQIPRGQSVVEKSYSIDKVSGGYIFLAQSGNYSNLEVFKSKDELIKKLKEEL